MCAFGALCALLGGAACRPFKTSMGRMTGSLDGEVPGHPGCYYRSNGDGALCSTTPRQEKYERAVLAAQREREHQQAIDERQRAIDTWTRTWLQAKQITLESDPHYSLLTPEIRSLSDGTQLWTYREGGDCQQTARTQSVTGAQGRGIETTVDCETLTEGNRSATNCHGRTLPPSPEQSVEQVCRNPDRISQFRLDKGIVVEARLTPRR